MKITIVICTFNGAARIRKVVDAIISSSFSSSDSFEIILVDNNSNDDVASSFLDSFSCSNIDHRVVQEPKQGLMYARYRGLKEAKHDLVTFIDDDNYIIGNWVDYILSIFENDNSIGALGGHGILYNKVEIEWFSLVQKAYAIGSQTSQALTYSNELSIVNSLYGAGITVRKEILNEYIDRGYQNLLSGRTKNDTSSGEDSEICELIKLSGYKCAASDNLKFYHDIPHSRLKRDYAIKLYRSFGVAFVRLLSLRRFNQYKFLPRFIISSPIFLKAFLRIYIFLLMWKNVGGGFNHQCKVIMVNSAIEEVDKITNFKSEFKKNTDMILNVINK